MAISKININGTEHIIVIPVGQVEGFPTPANIDGKFLKVVDGTLEWADVDSAADSELITVNDIDEICGASIQIATLNEVEF